MITLTLRKIVVFSLTTILFSGALTAELVKVKITASRANVRSRPDITSPVVAVLPAGTILESLGIEGNWHKIKLPDTVQAEAVFAFIHRSVVEVVQETRVMPEEEKGMEKPAAQPAPKPAARPEKREEPAAPPRVPTIVETEPKRNRLGYKLAVGRPWPSSEVFSGTLNIEGGVWYEMTKNIALELSAALLSYNSLGASGGLSKGRLSAAAIWLSVQGRFRPDRRIVPFVTAGGGYSVNFFGLDSAIVNGWADQGLKVSEKCQNAPALFGGAGVDVAIAERLALTGTLKYLISTAGGTWSMTDELTKTKVSGEIDSITLSALVLQAGVRVFF